MNSLIDIINLKELKNKHMHKIIKLHLLL